jgi:hypothetical protein
MTLYWEKEVPKIKSNKLTKQEAVKAISLVTQKYDINYNSRA